VKAALLSQYHQPLELVDRPYPEPERPDQVVVTIGGAGVCATDLHSSRLTPRGTTSIAQTYPPG
jgi:D-arabinose 1-dehydrogenase-like Zn-dependent alcohol dehydrogenase